MASTTALFTGLSGLLASSRTIDVVGNNIANVNTTAYKDNRLLLETTFSRTFSLGTAPSTNSGGSNPGQIGMGVSVAGTQRNFSNGALGVTGVSTDLALEGNGFFIVNDAGSTQYTRSGAFMRNAQNELVTISGGRVQGYGIDENFNIIQGSLVDMTLPIGTLTLAEATRNVVFNGNLNASGELGELGTQITSAELNALGTANPPPANPPFADDTTRLIDLDDGTGAAQFEDGDIVRLRGAEKGGKTIPTADLAVTTATTIADFMAFLEEALGIDTSESGDPGGVTIDGTTGVLTIEGNYGTVNELDVNTADILRLDSDETTLGQPFILTKEQEATGESVRNTFVVYDSLGTPLEVDLTMVYDDHDDTGTQWRYFAESEDSVGIDLRLNTGLITFDTNGQIETPAEFNVQVSRDDTGAVDPLSVTLSFRTEPDNVTSLSDTESVLAAVFQDGSPIGTLTDIGVGQDGVISGAFTNGLVRNVGQIALATFTNNEGLVDVGDNMFRTGPNSGTAVVSAPLTLGAGRVVGGALELSNVDLSQEFVDLITASTGYSAAGRVINTANELIQQLLIIGR